MERVEIYNDGILRATLFPTDWVYIEWLTNNRGYLQKGCVKAFFLVEDVIRDARLKGWAMASEIENTVMHKILDKVGGVRVNQDDRYLYFKKEFLCVSQ